MRVPALGVKKWEWWATVPRKNFDDIFSRLDTIHERVRQTDRQTDRRTGGQTDTGRQQRPRLRIASRGNKRLVGWLINDGDYYYYYFTGTRDKEHRGTSYITLGEKELRRKCYTGLRRSAIMNVTISLDNVSLSWKWHFIWCSGAQLLIVPPP